MRDTEVSPHRALSRAYHKSKVTRNFLISLSLLSVILVHNQNINNRITVKASQFFRLKPLAISSRASMVHCVVNIRRYSTENRSAWNDSITLGTVTFRTVCTCIIRSLRFIIIGVHVHHFTYNRLRGFPHFSQGKFFFNTTLAVNKNTKKSQYVRFYECNFKIK